MRENFKFIFYPVEPSVDPIEVIYPIEPARRDVGSLVSGKSDIPPGNSLGIFSNKSPASFTGDNLDRNANRETKFAVGAPLIDGDFNKPV
jgi:hypothetical protein